MTCQIDSVKVWSIPESTFTFHKPNLASDVTHSRHTAVTVSEQGATGGSPAWMTTVLLVAALLSLAMNTVLAAMVLGYWRTNRGKGASLPQCSEPMLPTTE